MFKKLSECKHETFSGGPYLHNPGYLKNGMPQLNPGYATATSITLDDILKENFNHKSGYSKVIKYKSS